MQRLSEFKDIDGIRLVSRLMLPIGRIVQNKQVKDMRTAAAKEGRDLTMLELASAMLEHGAGDVLEMLALLNREEPKEYHCNAATVLADVMQMFADPDLQALFGLQSKIPASSGSAPETIEAPETPPASFATSPPASSGKRKKPSGADM